MMLFYICFITIFLPQLSFGEVIYNPYPGQLKTKSNYQRIIQGISYHDGTVVFRLFDKELYFDNCKKQNLSFIGIPFLNLTLNESILDIPEINYCFDHYYNSLSTSGSPPPNPLPKCSEIQQNLGCNGKTLNCAKYPTVLNCTLDCSNIPYLPGCNDCRNNENALGCGECIIDSLDPRCDSGFCDNHPDEPECGLIKMDKVKIHAVDDIMNGKKFILVTYYCFDSTYYDCGRLIDMKGVPIKHYDFDDVCGGKFFKHLKYENDELEYLCYKPENDTIQLSINKGNIKKELFRLPLNTSNFNSNLLSVFVTEDGGYGIVNSSDATIFVTLIQKDKTPKNDFQIHLPSQAITNITRIYVCNIAYQSSGYSCVIQTTEGGQVTYYEVDFLSNGDNSTAKIELPLDMEINVITNVLPLNFGGYVIETINRINGTQYSYFIDNKGIMIDSFNLLAYKIYTSFVIPNNIIVSIPHESSIFDERYKKLSIYFTDHFYNISLVEGGKTFPGGPGGYGSSKILSTIPSRDITNLRDDILSKEFTIIYNTPISPSTGNFSVYQDNGEYPPTLKQTIPAKNDQFVTFNDDTVKLRILDVTLGKFNASYFITVDNDFVKEKSNDQNLIGIRKKFWNFNVKFASDKFLNESESAIIRLTIEGTKYYTNLTSVHKKEFVSSMEGQLRKAISCTGCLNITKYFQYDAHTSYNAKFNSAAYNAQILMRVDIDATNERSSNQLLIDLNDTIAHKEINSLVFGNTTYLDASYGALQIKNLWEYWGFLLAASLDIAFISHNGRDYIWIFPATIFFLIFPLFLNFIFACIIIVKEVIKGKKSGVFYKWWKSHRIIANTALLLSCLDIDALRIISSRDKSGRVFTDEGERSFLISTGVVILFEEIPQLIIYVTYFKFHIKPAIVPILVLSSCLIIIVTYLRFILINIKSTIIKLVSKPKYFDKEMASFLIKQLNKFKYSN
ncbi:hypothetical protein C1646_761728 [Rhizophagus diaphanus]|nr:hypothetical protein C1646_761728 [Rhizophagus diaphanus] [Rhizophagus sp. MUCL 43196]